MDFKKIEKKWQLEWEKSRVFEADVEKKKKFFTSMVIPYVNGNAHIGHSFTYTRTDAYARFKRMQGYNALLAQAFHATGEPILGTIERLKNKDESQIATFSMFGATDRDMENFVKKGPKFVAQFWAKKMEESFRSAGFSIDWRRKFILSVDAAFSKFIEWQYNTLKKKGYVVQGTHPVVWCPHDQSPTGDHDRLEGEGESPAEYILIKFKLGDAFLPAATLRPETVYGVTNLWLNPQADYVEALVNNEKWIVSKQSIEKIKDHIKSVSSIREFDETHQLFGQRCTNPVTGKELPILPSEFVDAGNATGVVMSVPAHAPYDFIALKELIYRNELDKYGATKEEVEPVQIVKTEEFGETPAKDIADTLSIKSLEQKDKLDEATSILYKKEFHTGVLTENCGPFAGLSVSEAKDRIAAEFIEKGISEIFYDVKNVVCRCTTKCHVKILENQWFLKYSDDKWKDLAKSCLAGMNIYPDEARNNFLVTLEWLKDKACARKSGLGTPLPWDKSWIVETLSDSTVYMAYYTISLIINKYRIPAKRLTADVFDYVFFEKGKPEKVSKTSGISPAKLKAMKEQFDYFYPLDFRNSAKELVQNHLTFFILHHVALWDKSRWPKAIAVNGQVNIEGEKMSKSKGNIIPLIDAINAHGADLTRINIATSSDGIDDADWRVENLNSFRQRYEFLFDLVRDVQSAKKREKRNIDLYLMSRIQSIIKTSTDNYETTRFRTAGNCALFEATNELKWYLTRVGGMKNADKDTLIEALSIIIRLLAPLTPHVCEEMWSMLGNKNFVSVAEWPKPDKKTINYEVEKSEILVKHVLDDVREIQKLLRVKPKIVKIFVAEPWKFEVYNIVMKNKKMPLNDITKTIMAGDLKRYGSATVSFVQSLYRKINDVKPVVPKEQQLDGLKGAADFMQKDIGCKIEILAAENSTNPKARASTPQKPGILLE